MFRRKDERVVPESLSNRNTVEVGAVCQVSVELLELIQVVLFRSTAYSSSPRALSLKGVSVTSETMSDQDSRSYNSREAFPCQPIFCFFRVQNKLGRPPGSADVINHRQPGLFSEESRKGRQRCHSLLLDDGGGVPSVPQHFPGLAPILSPSSI